MQSSATTLPADVLANVKSDATDVLAGAPTATPADVAKRVRKPAQAKKTAAKKTVAKSAAKTAVKREVHASSANTPALVLTHTEAIVRALTAKNADTKAIVKILRAQIARSKRPNTDSTPAQNARHAAIAADVQLTAK